MKNLLRSSFVLAFVLLLPASGHPCTSNDDCTDSSLCTVNERCDGGACVSDPVDCDDGNACTQDSCDSDAGCQHEDQPDGSSCSDGDVCNGEETCHGGHCGDAQDLDCDDDNPCTADSCASSGGCRHTPLPGCCTTDTDCIDSSACTVNESCQAGSCVSDVVSCDDGNACTNDSCDAVVGCRNLPVVNGIACGDGDVCNGTETCQGGTCTPDTPPACDDGNPCTTDGCDSVTGCTVQAIAGCCNSDADCTDSSACTVNERCVSHACVSDPLTCDDGNPCTTDGCNAATGCTFTPVPNGQSCGDLDPCNGLESCQSGTCTQGTAPLCDDGNPCTVDDCDSNSGCTHAAVEGCCVSDGDCVDADACTVNERCVAGRCTSDPRTCGDNNPCSQDSCVSTVGCVNTPLLDGTSCGDGNRCNGRERCSSGVCRPATPPDCDDHNPCTADSCAPSSGCQHGSIGGCCTSDTDCGDTDLCTLNEHCNGSHTCQSTPRSCDDGNICTEDTCNPSSGCVHSPTSVSCNDGDLCTSGDKCNAATCAGAPVVCSDGNYCDGAETCNEATGACEPGNTLPCSPGGRSPLRTCTAEWYVDDPNNLGGSLAKRHVCTQGDPTCDHDSSELTCTFRVAVCLRVPDPRFTPACALADVNAYELPRSLLKRNVSIASALMAALDSLPGARVEGMFSNSLTFSPAVHDTECTPLFSVPVHVGKKVTLKGKSSTVTGIRDKDKLKLACTAG
jgi:Dictyostelium (slime mold) repeat